MFLIDKLDHKPTIHRISTNTPQKDYIEQISSKTEENLVLRSKEREEAIQVLTMDPKIYGKLLTTHRRGLGDDGEALHGR